MMSDRWQGREFRYRWQLFPGFPISHHVCSGKPPNKTGTFLMAKKTTNTNQDYSALFSFNVDVTF